jgi:hypothetical protein
MTTCIPQLLFSLYRHRRIRADFSGGQISSDAGLLPLRAFDQRYGLTLGLAEHVCDPREEERVRHSVLALSSPAASANALKVRSRVRREHPRPRLHDLRTFDFSFRISAGRKELADR